MTRPRRIADGPAIADPTSTPDAAPRRGIPVSTRRSRVLPSAIALAVAATSGVLVLSSAPGLALGADPGATVSATPVAVAAPATLLGASVTPAAYNDADAQAEAVVIETMRAEGRAAEQAAADKAAADKAAAEKGAAAKAAAAKSTATKAAASTTTGGSKNYAPASNYGLKGGAVKTYQAVMSNFSGINSVGGYRASSLSNHQLGLAIDFMITPGSESALGWSIAKYLVAHASELNVDHIIFEQKIWTPANPTWRSMEDRGSTTANHYDHVHVSMKS